MSTNAEDEEVEAVSPVMPDLRISAYAVCVAEGRVLLARWVGPNGEKPWTLPGGGLDHGEDPYDAAIREAAEETGYEISIDRLLGIDSMRAQYPPKYEGGPARDRHGLRIVYAASVVGGALRHEVGGSTDRAEWIPLEQLPTLERIPLVDIAMALYHGRPSDGRSLSR